METNRRHSRGRPETDALWAVCPCLVIIFTFSLRLSKRFSILSIRSEKLFSTTPFRQEFRPSTRQSCQFWLNPRFRFFSHSSLVPGCWRLAPFSFFKSRLCFCYFVIVIKTMKPTNFGYFFDEKGEIFESANGIRCRYRPSQQPGSPLWSSRSPGPVSQMFPGIPCDKAVFCISQLDPGIVEKLEIF